MVRKVHPIDAKGGPQRTLVDFEAGAGPSPTVIPQKPQQKPAKRFLTGCHDVYHCVISSIVRTYKLLPWLTRRTISVAVQLCMVLYIFFTVPFRIAFYYDPYPSHNTQWTRELSIFTALDALADFIGLFEFVAFCVVWKAEFYELSSLTSSRSTKGRSDADGTNTQKLMVRRLSSANFQPGRVNWTISSIKPLFYVSSDDANQVKSQQGNMFARNVELVLETIALIPIELVPVALGAFNLLHLVRITKVCRLYRLRRCIARIGKLYSDRSWVQNLSSSGVDTLVRTIGLCAGSCHWAACAYMLIAHLQCGLHLEACNENVETSWVVRDRLFGASVARKYGRTLYWAARTLVLLGYDDVTPVSTAETLYVVCVVIMGALFGSSLLANFLFLFRFRNARFAAYSAHVDHAREYMRLQNIPRSVRQQVTAYFNYAWSTHRSLDSEMALELLPQHLQSKVVATLRANRIAQVCFLMKESVELINELALALDHRIYSPGDLIIEPKINAQMFFVIRGQVVLCSFTGTKPNECKAGDFFAEMCLLFPEMYLQKAIAKTFCELYVLTKAKFDGALSEHHPGMERQVHRSMTETLERYTMQLRKTKKILGLQDGFENVSGRTSLGRLSVGGRSKSSVGRFSMGKSTASNGRVSGGKSTRVITTNGTSPEGWRHYTPWCYPGSSFRLLWDTARLVAIVYVGFEVPYFAVFISMTEGRHMFVVDLAIDLRYAVTMLAEVFFTLDLILRSRFFAFVEPSAMLVIARPDLIFAAYKANGFFLDLLAWFPLGTVLDSLSTDSFRMYITFFRLFRLLRLRLVPKLMQELTDLCGVSSKLYLVVSLVLGVTLMLHIVGCVWFEMALYPPDSESAHNNSAVLISELTRPDCLKQATLFQNCSWVKFDCYAHIGIDFPQQDPDSMYQANFAYLRSVYWAMVTLSAVGYGDIVAFSTSESYFAALWVFLGGIINFGVMGAMSSTISNLMATHHHHIEKLNTANSIMERLNISKRLSADIRRFYHQQFVGHKQAYESQLLSHLPDHLCYQISSLLHSKAVKSVPPFDSASIEFLREVTGKFRHRSFQNGETICLEGDVCREFFVFLKCSKINIFYRSRKVPIRALQGGDCYGVNEFLLKRSHPSTLIAASHVHASVMSREQFDGIQRKFVDDLRDMREEAQTLWAEDRARIKCVMANLSKIKLQTHFLHTPSLFYQQDNSFSTDENDDQNFYTMSDTFTTVWNAVVTCWNVYNAAFVIFRICFHSHLHFSSSMNTAVWVADLSCDVFFAIDIYLRLYYFNNSEGGIQNLVERKEIDKHYLGSSAFKWDLFASLPIYTPFASGSMITGLCRLPRLARCVNLWTYLDDVIVEIQQHFASRNVSAYLSPLKLMIVLILVAHYVGCIFFLISEHECQHLERCWMKHDHLLHEYHESVPILYAKTFYWATTTLLLVGSREIVPRGTAGTLWTGFTCLGCTFVIGHIVGEISELILELGKENKQYKNRIASFENFATEHDLSSALRERVTYFFRVEFEETKGTDVCHTFRDLSANLQLKFVLEMYGRSIEKLPISRFLTSTQINNLALRLKSELFIPGDNILLEGTFGSRLCSLRKGMAAAYWTKSVASVAILMEGAFFGEIAFFLPNQRRLVTVRATTSCEVLYISKKEWQELWMPDDDSSGSSQKHAQSAILGWVKSRLQRYQRGCLRTASRAKNAATSLKGLGTKPTAKPMTRNPSRFLSEKRGSTLPRGHIKSNEGHVLVWAPTPPRKQSKMDICRMFVSPTMQLLEKKAEYLLFKTNACAQPLSENESNGLNSGNPVPHSINHPGTRKLLGCWTGGRNASVSAKGSTKTDDLRQRQFIVDLNPINEYLGTSLGADSIRELETESWARFKLLAALQHVVSRLHSDLIPSDAGAEATLQLNIPVKTQTHKHKQLRPFRFDERARRKWSAAVMQMVSSVSRRKTTHEAAFAVVESSAAPRPSAKMTQARRRSFPSVLSQAPELQGSVVSSKPASGQNLVRSRSLPFFGDDFFSDKQHFKGYYKLTNDGRKGGRGIDFEILQRCQRPQYATQLHWYHRYRRWKKELKGSVFRSFFSLEGSTQRENQISPLGEDLKLAESRHPGNPRLDVVNTDHLQIPNQQALRSMISDFQSKLFIRRVQHLGKVWDLAILLATIYYLLVTPFKVCFSHEVTKLSNHALRAWSGLEIFLDVLYVVDIIYKVFHATPTTKGLALTATRESGVSLWHSFVLDSELRSEIVGMLPLELILFAADIRLPGQYLHLGSDTVDATWWITRWALRLNRMLLFRRTQSLSEELFQFAIQDLKLPVSEALLYFLRDLTTYLVVGHLIACVWFITSEIGLWYYGVSWLSTPGMLVYSSEEVVVAESHRALQEITPGFTLESVPLARDYLRSLLFAMECISTLFYGDIVSMNLLELVVEIGITFCAIYIYGALIGAQGEWIDSTARQEAAFEQNLAELQHFLDQNDVPKGLKRQVKAYYARIWRRHQGKPEFASVANVSRALYEDVVSATLHDFAAQVRVFRDLDGNFLRGLLACLEYVVCSEGEEVASKGDMDRSMYFIAQGRVLVRMDSGESVRERGEFFGEFALLYGISRLETCIALSVAELYRLDQEPYERLLQDFPGHRRRNKQSWTTAADANRSALRAENCTENGNNTANSVIGRAPILARRRSVPKNDALAPHNIENEVAHTYVYTSTMEMMAQLQTMHPEEAKNLILRVRAGSRKRLSRELAHEQDDR